MMVQPGEASRHVLDGTEGERPGHVVAHHAIAGRIEQRLLSGIERHCTAEVITRPAGNLADAGTLKAGHALDEQQTGARRR